MPRHRPCHYSVRPRFGPGSPAMVHEHIAEQVARDEREFHEHAAAGRYGDEAQAKAQDDHALYGISYFLEEHPKFWRYFDLITEEERDISFAQWRLEDVLIRKGHRPSEARLVAEEVLKLVPKLNPCLASDVCERFEKSMALYEGSAHPFPRERALKDSIHEAATRG